MKHVFHEDYYAHQWMEWRSSIETGELTTNVAVIPETERELAAKYKVLAAPAPAKSPAPAHGGARDDVYVLYAVAFVLGRHYEYVKAIWRTLVCVWVGVGGCGRVGVLACGCGCVGGWVCGCVGVWSEQTLRIKI
jgi:hypothetical protein